MQTNDTGLSQQTLFPIGAVARITGVSKDTIRAWERRYGAVEPQRTRAGGRLYSRDDIARLALLKRLTDGGERAGQLCKLSTEDLTARLEMHAQHIFDAGRAATTPPRVVVVGGSLTAQLKLDGDSMPGVEVVGLHQHPEALATSSALRPDVLVVEFPTVDDGTGAELNRLMTSCGAQRALLVYGFGTRRSVQSLDGERSTPVRAPVGLTELRRLILAGALASPSKLVATSRPDASAEALVKGPPQRRFDDGALTRLGASATPVACECPHHLVDLIRSLLAFESYSQDCDSRNEEDAAVHRFLHQITAEARALLETGLAEVAKHEGLLPSDGQGETLR